MAKLRGRCHGSYLEQGVDLNSGLRNTGESALGTLASTAKTTEGTSILGDVEARFLLEVLLEELQEVVVEILTTKVGVTSGSLHGEDTTSDVEERYIEGSTAEIKNENILLRAGLAVETVGNGGSGRLVDDTKNLETSDGARILGSETLRVVEVGRDTIAL